MIMGDISIHLGQLMGGGKRVEGRMPNIKMGQAETPLVVTYKF